MSQMSSGPVVSVIIIFLDAAPFIEEAVESVLAQTYHKWELLLVDDGSTDGSTAIARGYVETYPDRLRYLEHKSHQNRGMSASRNLGIRHAQGEYITFLDADDVWFMQTLEEQVSILESQPKAGMVYGPIQYWFSWTGKQEDRECDYTEELGIPTNTTINPPVLLPLFLENRAAVPSGFMVRREVVEAVGGFEDAFRGEYEDQVFCAKVCIHVPVYASGHCWYRYRQHQNSSVSIGHSTGQTYFARLSFLNWLAGYLTEQNVTDGRVWRALHREFWRYRRPMLFRWLRRWQRWTGWMDKYVTFASPSGSRMVR